MGSSRSQPAHVFDAALALALCWRRRSRSRFRLRTQIVDCITHLADSAVLDLPSAPLYFQTA